MIQVTDESEFTTPFAMLHSVFSRSIADQHGRRESIRSEIGSELDEAISHRLMELHRQTRRGIRQLELRMPREKVAHHSPVFFRLQ